MTSLDQLRRLHLDGSAGTQIGLDLIGGRAEGLGGYFTMIDERINQALALRELVSDGDVRNVSDAHQRDEINARADRLLDDLRLVADAVASVCYTHAGGSKGSTEAALRDRVLPLVADLDRNRMELVGLGNDRPMDAPAVFPFFHWAIEFPEVVQNAGFDAIVGNPPFQGANRITQAMGASYRAACVRYVATGSTGSADLVAYFFRRAATVARTFGLVATNTISQGDTHRVGLAQLKRSGDVYRAIPSERWPGRDAVFVAKVWWSTRPPLKRFLDHKEVSAIETDLWPAGAVSGRPIALPSMSGAAGKGVVLRGSGFILDDAGEAARVCSMPRHEQVVRSYISGTHVNSDPRQQSTRQVINFQDWPQEAAAEFSEAFKIVEERVKPERMGAKPDLRTRWWQFGERRDRLNARLRELDEVIVLAQTSSRVMPILVKTGPVFTQKVVVFPWSDRKLYGVLSSALHRVWVDRYSSTMKQDVSYSLTDCFETFPLPGQLQTSELPKTDALTARNDVQSSALSKVGTVMLELHSWRSEQMIEVGEGITQFYGRFHDPAVDEPGTAELRERHVELDEAVRDAYDWADLELGHDFYETRYGRFFTVSTEARFELLMRLLELNFQQAAEQTGRSLEAVMKEAQQHV